MASRAVNICVRTIEHEFGLRVVIKEPEVPRNRVVAGFAIFVEHFAVRVVFDVAIVARGSGLCEDLAFVARVAFEVDVLTEQREAGQAMIEGKHVVPVRLAVAILASLPLLPLVRFVIRMTRDTGRSQRDLENRLDVAVIANRFRVRAVERISCVV